MSVSETRELQPYLPDRTGVVVASGYPVVRRGLKSIINEQPDMKVLDEADSLSGLESCVEQIHPHVGIVDVRLMKTGSVFDTIKKLREAVALLMLQNGSDVFFEKQLIAAGVKGVISLDETENRILEAVRKLREGNIFSSKRLSNQLLSELNCTGGVIRSPADCLSPRELEIFCMFGEGMDYKKIAARLGLATKTVVCHRQKIENKLELYDSCEVCRYATRYVQESGGNGLQRQEV
ncbi:hypothetical protein A3A67_02735 [Candidatus Peribacteria bacterium RIFCSPLOWO2_01_FULL_51_18]|nr:MAG: hypothetical protein A3A67_02735 [Candidatus Peribacteria bacterium RIFCSPLOWO2_01_FULL_51_18]